MESTIFLKILNWLRQFRLAWAAPLEHEISLLLTEIRNIRASAEAAYKHHQEDVLKERKAVHHILSTLSKITWRRDPVEQSYRLSIDLSPGMIALHTHLDGPRSLELEIIADYVASEVKGQIMTSKFVRMATEQQYLDKYGPFRP